MVLSKVRRDYQSRMAISNSNKFLITFGRDPHWHFRSKSRHFVIVMTFRRHFHDNLLTVVILATANGWGRQSRTINGCRDFLFGISTSLTAIRDVKMRVTRSWKRPFRWHSTITPSLGPKSFLFLFADRTDSQGLLCQRRMGDFPLLRRSRTRHPCWIAQTKEALGRSF